MSKTSSAASIGALAALMLSACAPSTGTTMPSAPSTLVSATRTPQVPVTTVTIAAPPPVTVTVPPSAPATPVAQHIGASGPFQSPSGNIRCSMASYSTGGNTVRCEVTDHLWTATKPVDCHLNWGDRVSMDEGSMADFGCYGQDMPAPDHTLEYGQMQTLGTLECVSRPVGVRCTDTGSGHYFLISRDVVAMS